MALTQVSTGGIKDGQVHTIDLADGQITAAKLHADAQDITYTLGASGTDHYTFTGEGLTGAVNDPTLYLTRGKTYRFVNGNSSGAHPFRIQSVAGAGGAEYNTGVTNNAGAGGSTIIFEVPHDAPDVLYYICTSHANMNGIFYVTGALADGSVTYAKLASPIAADNEVIKIGTHSDLELYHSGSHSVIRTKTGSTGDLNIRSDNNIILGSIASGGKTSIQCIEDGAAELYHNNNKKFETSNTGAIVNGTCTATAFAGDGSALTGITSFVSGMIIMYNSATAPTGWHLCDGNNGTPDLRDRFIVGAGSTYSQGNTGGAASVTLAQSEMPNHYHDSSASVSDPGHNHQLKGGVDDSDNMPARVGPSDANSNLLSGAMDDATTGISVSVSVHSEGGGSAHENRPPYYALTFIMKA